MTDINDFGRTSFVMHTTGLKERLEKRTMIKYRDAHGNIIVITDESHLFVTKDRLGKDVFAGDKCKAHVFMENSPSYLIGGEVVYNNCGYCIAVKSTYYHMNDLMNIELIGG